MLHIYNLTPNTGQLVYLWGKSSRSGWDIKFRNSMPKFRPWRLRSKQHPFPELQSKAYNVILLCTSVFFFQVFLVHEIILSWIYMHRSVFPNRKVNLFCIWCEYVIYMAKCFAWLRLDVCLLGFVTKWLDLRINTGMIAGFLLWRHARGGIGKVLVQRAMYKIYMYPIVLGFMWMFQTQPYILGLGVP